MPYVLAVEGDYELRQSIVYALASWGYEVDALQNPDGAYRMAQLRKPDLILMDLATRAAEGIATLDCLRRDAACRDVPVLALTAPVLGKRLLHQLRDRLRIDDCMDKPAFHLPRLKEKITNLIDGSRASKQPEQRPPSLATGGDATG